MWLEKQGCRELNSGWCSRFLFFQDTRWSSYYGWNNASARRFLMWTFRLWENRDTAVWSIISKVNLRINWGERAKTMAVSKLSERLFFLLSPNLLLYSSPLQLFTPHTAFACTVLMFSVGHYIGFHWLKTTLHLVTATLSSLACSLSPSG